MLFWSEFYGLFRFSHIYDLNLLTYSKWENIPHEERYNEKGIKQNLIHYLPINTKLIKYDQ